MKRVAVAIILRDSHVLVCQRKRGSRYELKWEFPGGKVEPGESLEACVRRELREELAAEVGPVVGTESEMSYYEDGGMFEVHYFTFREHLTPLKNLVFEDIRWVNGEELLLLDILEGNKGIVERLVKGPLREKG
ncbi:MAG: NUDIX domain-containing protein [Bacteroidetes bacterium]|jgi:8-oxo-dGTP diphosphatase|nr:NUDIX domain-containing protein [Bacteroidota bacterium]